MSTALVVAGPSAIARQTIGHHSKSFALASKLLDARTRDQTAIVYTYCRRADDAIDESADPAGALAQLRSELDDIYDGQPLDPVLAAFARIARERALPRRYPEELLAGFAMDVERVRYATLDELRLYCHRVASVVGLMMCHVFGVRDERALVPAAQLGVAMQLTNICRDVAEDWRRGRLYLPDELLARHGAAGLASELGGALPRAALAPIAATVRELLAIADRQYRAADRGIPALPWRAAVAVRAARRIYAAIGTRIERADFDVTAGRAVVGKPMKITLALGAMGRTLVAWPGRAFAAPPRIPTKLLEARDVPLA